MTYESVVETVCKLRSRKPEARYPGITRVLSGTSDKSGLDAWRRKVGHEEANRITLESTTIGNSLDKMAMESFKYDFNLESYQEAPGYPLFHQLQPYLSEVIPAATQLRLWSDKLKLKGFADIVGWYKGEFSIIDVKNTKRTKRKEYIKDYFIQCTAYSMMLFELTGLQAKQVVILMADRSASDPQIFTERTSNYVRETISRVRHYHELELVGDQG